MSVMEWLVVLYAFGAMLLDLKTRKIDNRYLIAGWAAGGIIALLQPFSGGLLRYLGGALLPVLLLYILFYYRMMGAGDIKLLSVLGGMLGIRSSIFLLICSFLAGGILAAVVLTVTGAWARRFRFFVRYVKNYRATGIRVPYRPKASRRAYLHFSLPVFAAVLLWKGGVF